MYYNKIMLEERDRKGITQKEMAEFLGLKQQQYARYEKGINLMPITYLPKIAQLLNISIDYMLGLTNEKRPYPRKK